MRKVIYRELECLLTPEELGVLGIKACEEREKARLLKEEAKELETAAKEKEKQVSEKRIKRKVECSEEKLFERNEVHVIRQDNPAFWPDGLATVETRPMTGDERQTLIDVDSGKAPKVATKAPGKKGKKDDAN